MVPGRDRPGQPVRGRLDDDQVAVDEHRGDRLGEVGGQRATPCRSPGRSGGPRRCTCPAPRRRRPAARSPPAGAGSGRSRPDRRRGRSRTGPRRPRCGRGSRRPVALQPAQRGGLGVDDPEPVAGRRPGRWAGRARRPTAGPSCRPSTVVPARISTPPVRVDAEQQVDAGGGDHEPAVPPGDVPGRRHGRHRAGDRCWRSASAARQVGDGGHLAVREPDAADQVVDGVGDHDVVADASRRPSAAAG